MAQTIYRTDDGSEWASLDQAENHEKRMDLIDRKLSELGGQLGLYQLIAKSAEERGFAATYVNSGYAGELAAKLAIDMDELIALAAVLKPILDECGKNPYPLDY